LFGEKGKLRLGFTAVLWVDGKRYSVTGPDQEQLRCLNGKVRYTTSPIPNRTTNSSVERAICLR
jgi:hypothetical protein